MIDKTTRVEEFLAHYASEFYDPQKAHEYYERNKELKGRKSTKGFSDTQKQALSYTKNQIGAAKKAELEKSQADQKAKLEAIRKSTEASRARIAAKLQGLLSGIQAKALKSLPPKPKPKLQKLNEIPPNASPKLRAYLEKQNDAISKTNKQTVDKANADYAIKVQAAQKTASESSVAARKAASAEIKKVGADAKASVQKARDAYAASRKQTDAKYKQASDTEFENIRTQLPMAPPKVKKPRQPRKRRAKKSETTDTTATTTTTQ